MSKELSTWLRQQRQVRGWTRPEMAHQLVAAGQARGDRHIPSIDSMCSNIYRWEQGLDNPSERYKLHYCRALGIPPGQFGADQAGDHLAEMPAPAVCQPARRCRLVTRASVGGLR
jgi:transcriptional regulator with XRE-family HTH domain